MSTGPISVLGSGLFEQPRHLLEIGDVCNDRQAPTAGGSDLGSGVITVGKVADDQISTRLGESLRDASAESAAGPGHQRHLA